MATQNPEGKKGKKAKKTKQVFSLDEFHAGIEDPKASVPEGQSFNWSDEPETRSDHKRNMVLPTIPRGLVDPSTLINYEILPNSPPYILVVDNAPFGIPQAELEKFFARTPYTEIIANVEFGKRRAPTIEFETRDLMVKAITEKFNQEIGGRLIHLKTVSEMNNYGGDRENRGRDRFQNRERDFNVERPEIPEGEWRRDAVPSFPDRQPEKEAGFDRQGARQTDQDSNRGGDFRFERNMEIQYSERAQPQSFQRDSRSGDRREIPQRQSSQRDNRAPSPDQRFRSNSPPADTYGSRPPGPSYGDRRGPNDRYDRGPSSRDRERTQYSTPYGELPPPGYDPRPPRRDRDYSPNRRQQYGGRSGYQQQSGSGAHRDNRDYQRNDARNDADIVIQRSSFIPTPPAPASIQNPKPQEAAPRPVVETPKERPKLQLAPRTVPLDVTPVPAHTSTAIFGGAKPVDTTAKEREVELKLQRDREEKEQLAKEREATSVTSPSSPKQLLTHKSIQIAASVDVVQQRTSQIHISHRVDRDPPRDTRPVASVPPFRKEQSTLPSRDVRNDQTFTSQNRSAQQQSTQRPFYHQEPVKPELEKPLQTSNRFAAVDLIQDDVEEPIKELVSRTSSRDTTDEPQQEAQDFGAESDTSSTGFQVVGNKKQRAGNQRGGYSSRTFHATRGGQGGGAGPRRDSGSRGGFEGNRRGNMNRDRRSGVGVGQE